MSSILKLSRRMYLLPSSSILPGLATLLAAIGLVPVSPCSGAEIERQGPVSFQEEVIPLFTRMGCNQGACHGKQAGQNGFRLSLHDVTWLSKFVSNDEGLLDVSTDGLVTPLRNGETAVRVHFRQLVEAVIFSVPYEAITPAEIFARRNNAIDELVFGKLAQLHIPPADLCDDARFLRRAGVNKPV